MRRASLGSLYLIFTSLIPRFALSQASSVVYAGRDFTHFPRDEVREVLAFLKVDLDSD